MTIQIRILLVSLLTLTRFGPAQATGNPWIDSFSLTLGQDDNSIEADVFRLGIQNRWNRTLFNGGAWFVAGYWDLSLAYMESDVDNSDLYEVGITPVLRLQRDADLSSGISPFSEIGIGAHLLSETRLGGHDLDTALQFGSHLGVGLGFGDKGRYEVAYRFQHLSNADLGDDNDGVDFHLVKFAYNFE
jgi:hypothetical protein